MRNMLLMKTRKENLQVVVSHGLHATDSIPANIGPGDIIMISQTVDTLGPHEEAISFAGFFGGHRPNSDGKSLALWGRWWDFIIEIEGLVRLDRPFCIGDVQISNKNYGPGPRYEYVHAWDQEHIINEGYLAPLLNLRSLGIGSTISVPWAIIKKAANDNEEEN